ncbi:MAG: hypothetical protein VYB09_03860 [Planctomycetota bacterium]|nr:hypothetical protein [Planctomycetota bacterium]
MYSVRHVFVFLLAGPIFSVPARAADQYWLRLPADGSRRWQQVERKLDVRGQVRMQDSTGKENRQEVSVEGHHAYEEGIALTDLERVGSDTVGAVRALRLYQPPRVVMMVGQLRLVPRLRESRRTILMSSQDGKIAVTSLSGSLTREEQDLVRNQGDSALLPLLLPVDPVEAGDRWKISPPLVAAMLNLDQVHRTTVQGALAGVKESVATVQLAGEVAGVVESVRADVSLRGTLKVNLRHRRVERLELEIEEKRAIGRAQPGLDIKAQLLLTIRPLNGPFQLSADLLEQAARRPAPGDELLEFQPRHADYRLLHNPRWHVTSDRSSLSLMRYIKQGKVLSQCAISRLPTGGQVPATLDRFEQDVRESLGSSFLRLIDASEETTMNKMKVMRVVAEGVSEELPVQWIYYHVEDRQGRRVAASFSIPADLADDFRKEDRSLMRTLYFDRERTRQLEGVPVSAGSSNSSKPSQSRTP